MVKTSPRSVLADEGRLPTFSRVWEFETRWSLGISSPVLDVSQQTLKQAARQRKA